MHTNFSSHKTGRMFRNNFQLQQLEEIEGRLKREEKRKKKEKKNKRRKKK